MKKRIIIRAPFPTPEELAREYGLTRKRFAQAIQFAEEVLQAVEAKASRRRRKKTAQKEGRRSP